MHVAALLHMHTLSNALHCAQLWALFKETLYYAFFLSTLWGPFPWNIVVISSIYVSHMANALHCGPSSKKLCTMYRPFSFQHYGPFSSKHGGALSSKHWGALSMKHFAHACIIKRVALWALFKETLYYVAAIFLSTLWALFLETFLGPPPKNIAVWFFFFGQNIFSYEYLLLNTLRGLLLKILLWDPLPDFFWVLYWKQYNSTFAWPCGFSRISILTILIDWLWNHMSTIWQSWRLKVLNSHTKTKALLKNVCILDPVCSQS